MDDSEREILARSNRQARIDAELAVDQEMFGALRAYIEEHDANVDRVKGQLAEALDKIANFGTLSDEAKAKLARESEECRNRPEEPWRSPELDREEVALMIRVALHPDHPVAKSYRALQLAKKDLHRNGSFIAGDAEGEARARRISATYSAALADLREIFRSRK